MAMASSNTTSNIETFPAEAAAASSGGGGAPAVNGVQVAFRLSTVNYKSLKFVIMDRPTNDNLPSYLLNLKRAGVTALVRVDGTKKNEACVCEPTYDTDLLIKAGISVHELPFEDGQSPPKDVISKWRAVVKTNEASGGCVAIHCVAGLGRAPVMVAIALINKGLDFTAAAELIRKERKGALNKKQLDFLRSYKSPSPSTCIIL